ncbi:unnamed protein product [Prorocentrum cordatum]|uniref:Deacetylase sirtuin-type domain-containing protein n=1 Tax=Prorocentrum cordatum TaxID=2364126 RepID=A0ABN9W441_9DINO|nr:unnamed protein product [Polarella glacialis]
MGASPSAPSPEQAESLRGGVDEACARAARAIGEADVLLLCTGAGFSADSGLAVYADVARVEAYAKRGLQYHDICQPHWLESEPELFWGFWGQCFNDYRSTPPHEGYAIIDGWADRWFRRTELAQKIRQKLQAPRGADGGGSEAESQAEQLPLEPYVVSDAAGAFFVFTSNVDAHHFDWFRACEIRECHGNTETYQCTRGCKGLWRAPLDFRFCVDATMLAPAGEPGAAIDAEAAEGAGAVMKSGGGEPPGGAAARPRLGHVRGGGRLTTLRHMPGPLAGAAGFGANHPVCPSCGAPARPAILMFGDGGWLDLDEQEKRWFAWADAACSAAKDAQSGDRPLRAVVLEIGAGGNVPTVRRTSEDRLHRFGESGAMAKLIRVNPDLPLGDRDEYEPAGEKADCIISVMDGGLASLRRIDAALGALWPADPRQDGDRPGPRPGPRGRSGTPAWRGAGRGAGGAGPGRQGGRGSSAGPGRGRGRGRA